MSSTIIKEFAADHNFGDHKMVGGLGPEVGLLKIEDGKIIEGGRVTMRDRLVP